MRIIKILSAVAGLLALVVSAGLVLGGASLLTVTSNDGLALLPSLRVTDPGVGILADDIDLHVDSSPAGVSVLPRDVAVKLDVMSDKPVFVGIGREADVLEYLRQAGYQLADRPDEIGLTLPANSVIPDPAEADFWLATNEGGSLEWAARQGEFAVLAVNVDGSNGIDLAVDGTVDAPFLRPAGGLLMALGLTAAVAGVALFYLGVRREPPPPARRAAGVAG